MTGNYDPSETLPVSGDPVTFFRSIFKRQQEPVFWLLSARINKDSAEAVFADQLRYEPSFIADNFSCADDFFDEDGDHYGEQNDKRLRIGPGYFMQLREGPHYQAAWLLYALAIENALKGLALANNPALKRDDRLHRKIATHELGDLAFLAGMATNQYERNLLKFLSHQISWSGRYPIPLFANEVIPRYVGDTHRERTSLTGWPELRYAVRSLYHKLDCMVYDWIMLNVPRDIIDVPPPIPNMQLP